MRELILSDIQIPKIGEGRRGTEAPIGYLLRQASTAHRTQFEKILSDLNVTLPQFSVLKVLSLYPGISNADLARMCLLTPQTISVIVKNLKRMEALSSRPHAIHGRIQHLDLTPAGKKLLSQCDKRVDVFQTSLSAGLSAAEEKVIKQWLIKVASQCTEES